MIDKMRGYAIAYDYDDKKNNIIYIFFLFIAP